MINREKWLHAILCDRRLPGASFRVAYWLALKDGCSKISLGDYEREGLGHRRTAQRALLNLEWAGFLEIERRTSSGGAHVANGYRLKYPEKKARRSVAGIAQAAAAALALGLVSLMPIGDARAMEAPSGWRYNAWCCSNRDCAQIPASAVRAGRHGYEVVLEPGMHPMVPQGFAFVVPYTATEGRNAQLRVSQDGFFHACILPAIGRRTEPEPRCFYAPPPGS